MLVRINCPSCKSGFNVEHSTSGQVVNCPQCKMGLRLGALATPPPAAPPPAPKSAPPKVDDFPMALVLDDPPLAQVLDAPRARAKPAPPAGKDTTPDDFDLPPPPRDGLQTTPRPPARSRHTGGSGSTSPDDFNAPSAQPARPAKSRYTPKSSLPTLGADEGAWMPQQKIIIGVAAAALVVVGSIVLGLLLSSGKTPDALHEGNRDVARKDRDDADPPLPPRDEGRPPRDEGRPPRDGNPIRDPPEPPKETPLPPGALRRVGPLREPPPELKVPALADDRSERLLPGSATDAVVGGNGRWLVLLLAQEKKAAIFDLNEAKVTGFIELPSSAVRIAAGLRKLIVADPATGRVECWNLDTRQREGTATLPLEKNLADVFMGSASNGPLVVTAEVGRTHGYAPFSLFDPESFKPVVPDYGGPINAYKHSVAGHLVRVSPDGRVITAREGIGGEPHTMRSFVLQDGRGEVFEKRGAEGSLAPMSFDGSRLFLYSGVYNARYEGRRPLPATKNYSACYLPAVQGDWFLFLEPKDGRGRNDVGHGSVSFFTGDGTQSFLTLRDVAGVFREDLPYGGTGKPVFQHDRRLFFSPAAKLLVAIPTASDRLMLYRVDVEDALAKSGEDHLAVTSLPPRVARRGQNLGYQVTAVSNKMPLTYQLDSAPAGMAISKTGMLTWTAPAAGFPTAEVGVIVRVSNSAGREVYHKFTLSLLIP